MTLSLDENPAKFQIRAYQPGKIQVNETIYQSNIIVSANELISPWRPEVVSDLLASDFAIILHWKPSLLLIGTGKELIFPDLAVYGELMNAGIGVEIMDTRAACHTFAALTAEDRNVVAALLL